jgi:hypothetical protein
MLPRRSFLAILTKLHFPVSAAKHNEHKLLLLQASVKMLKKIKPLTKAQF